MKGVSVIVCCYNSEKLLTPTIAHLLNQQIDGEFGYEIIVVDNNSSDSTAQTAARLLEASAPNINSSIIHEEKPGLAYARKAGINKAKYNYVIFCDDDNWLAPDYVARAFKIMEADNTLAAIGGKGDAVFETEKPGWFNIYESAYATGSQEGNLKDNLLFGAGIVIRKQILSDLFKANFHSILPGRTQGKLLAGDDAEYTIVFKILGFNINYLPELKFKHFLKQERLNYTYLKKMFIGFGNSRPQIDCYKNILNKNELHSNLQWIWLFLKSILRTIYWFTFPPPGKNRIMYLLWNRAYISSCWQLRNTYKKKQDYISKTVSSYHALNKV